MARNSRLKKGIIICHHFSKALPLPHPNKLTDRHSVTIVPLKGLQMSHWRKPALLVGSAGNCVYVSVNTRITYIK